MADAPEAACAPDLAARGCVLLDFDGTLADTRAAIVGTAERVLRERGLTEDEIGDAGRLVGPPFPAAFSQVYGMSAEEAREVGLRYRELFTALGAASHPLFPGIRELLGDLRASGRRLALTTSRSDASARRFLEEEGIAGLFEAVVAQTDPARADKAHLVADSLAALGCPASDAVMVGDRFYDVEGARANGVPCVGARYGGTAAPGELERAGAVACACSVGELRRLLMGGARREDAGRRAGLGS